MIRAVTTVEPEWDEQTRRWALALEAFEASLCPCGCGYPTQMAHDESLNWIAPAPVRCHARTAMLARQTAVSENKHASALLLHAEPTTGSHDG